MPPGAESQPLILSVETATLAGSVALARGNEIVAASGGDSRISHSNTLLNDIEALLNGRHTALAEIDLFAVAIGPGSFTGLRIGIATVKALAETLGRPCAGIPTLEAIALDAGASEKSVALLPAGRGEIFAQLFSVTKDGLVTALDHATHISPQKLLEKYGSLESVVWCGDGAIANSALLTNGRIALPIQNLATHVASLALRRFRDGTLQQADALQALYVRPSDAELKV
jgi:tRNA threonylcarbamoyladenosine biosynthesis protein TsaB